MNLYTNNRISKLSHELLELIPYNAFLEKLREANTHWYIGGKFKKPTIKDIRFAVIFNIFVNMFNINDLTEGEMIYINEINTKLRRIMRSHYNSGVRHFRVKIKYDKCKDNNYIQIFFSERKYIGAATYKCSSIILKYQLTNQCVRK